MFFCPLLFSHCFSSHLQFVYIWKCVYTSSSYSSCKKYLGTLLIRCQYTLHRLSAHLEVELRKSKEVICLVIHAKTHPIKFKTGLKLRWVWSKSNDFNLSFEKLFIGWFRWCWGAINYLNESQEIEMYVALLLWQFRLKWTIFRFV